VRSPQRCWGLSRVVLASAWRLFNLRDDPAERDDLSRQHPDVLAQMLSEWNRYVAANGVIVKAGAVK
jgi:hypothetical protein